MKIILNTVVVLCFALILLVITKTFTIPHKEYYQDNSLYIYSKGNATGETRNEIIKQLEKFQKGYIKRDLTKVDQFVNELFTDDNILILGTMPNEVFYGTDGAKTITYNDWAAWGDVKLLMKQANISIKDSVAWVSTIGYVEFDLSRMLVLPLRFTAVLVKEESIWKFQQNQWQFDLDNLKILLTIILTFLLLGLSFLRLIFIVIKTIRKTKE